MLICKYCYNKLIVTKIPTPNFQIGCKNVKIHNRKW